MIRFLQRFPSHPGGNGITSGFRFASRHLNNTNADKPSDGGGESMQRPYGDTARFKLEDSDIGEVARKQKQLRKPCAGCRQSVRFPILKWNTLYSISES